MGAFEDWLERLREKANTYPEWEGEPMCVVSWAEMRVLLKKYDELVVKGPKVKGKVKGR